MPRGVELQSADVETAALRLAIVTAGQAFGPQATSAPQPGAPIA